MDKIERHPYVTALVIAGTVFTIGALIVLNRAGISPAGNSNGLSINGVILPTNSAEPLPVAPPPSRPTPVNVPYTNVTSPTPPPAVNPPPAEVTPFNWNSFVALLTHTSTQASTSTKGPSISDSYTFIPSGLFSPPQAQSQTEMSASQKALYGWGEDAGGVILGYEDSHPNQPQILTDHIQDRENPAKIAAMKKLGSDLEAVGEDIEGVGDAPPQISAASHALAAAYHEIGRNLAAIPDAKGDDATVKAILAYDKSAEAFVQKFVNVVLVFQANNVKFTQNESGRVFMFPSSQ
jgi:hypothetical protein